MSNNIISLQGANLYQGQFMVLHDVNFNIMPGEFAYIIGRTGSGKSSLLKTLYGELPLNEGKGTIAGYDLTSIKPKEIPYLRRKLGIVFQDFQLLSDRNVNENLEFVLRATGWKDKAAITARIKEVLEMVGLGTKHFKMPHELSGGEQQRVVVARALLNHPQVILADEPTGNLDPDVSDDIMNLLHSICQKGTGVVMATHDYRLIGKFAARVYRCVNGTITQADTPVH